MCEAAKDPVAGDSEKESLKQDADKKLEDGGKAAEEAMSEEGYPSFNWEEDVENADTYLPSRVLRNAAMRKFMLPY